MSLHDRIREARKKANMTQAALAKAVKVAPSTIAGWEARMEPSAAQLGLVAQATGVTAGFLLQDEVKDIVQPVVSSREMQMLGQYRQLDEYGRDAVDGVLSVEFRRCQEAARKSQLYRFMVYDFPAAAGPGISIEDARMYTVLLNEPPPRGSFGVKVSGRSMEPTLMDGDLLYVRHATEVPEGQIGIFTANGETVVKRAGPDRLISDNKEFSDVYPDESGAVVHGVVIGRVPPEAIIS